MKVLMLNGSFNPDGSTKAGLDIMAGTFAEEGVETEIVTVGGKPIADCIACALDFRNSARFHAASA